MFKKRNPKEVRTTLLMVRELLDRFLIYPLPKGRLKNTLRALFMRKIELSHYGVVSQGDTIIHAGCFMIETVTKWSEAVGPKGKVYIIEAGKENCQILKREIAQRNLSNVKIIHKGVWDSKGTMTLQTSSYSHMNKLKEQSAISKINSDEDFEGQETVQVDSLDAICKEEKIDSVDAVYLTISGAEREAIQGMKTIIAKFKPRIWVRSTLHNPKTDKLVVYELANALKKQGFKISFGRKEKVIGRNMFAYHPQQQK